LLEFQRLATSATPVVQRKTPTTTTIAETNLAYITKLKSFRNMAIHSPHSVAALLMSMAAQDFLKRCPLWRRFCRKLLWMARYFWNSQSWSSIFF